MRSFQGLFYQRVALSPWFGVLTPTTRTCLYLVLLSVSAFLVIATKAGPRDEFKRWWSVGQ